MQISCYDTAGSVLLLGCTNGSIYYFDMQKFPLRMKDNDLLITELYKDPNGDIITAISVYLTPKTSKIEMNFYFFKICVEIGLKLRMERIRESFALLFNILRQLDMDRNYFKHSPFTWLQLLVLP